MQQCIVYGSFLCLLFLSVCAHINVKTLYFSSTAKTVWFTEDMKYELICQHDGDDAIEIRTPAFGVIENTTYSTSDEHEFRKINSTTSVFVIQTSRRDEGTYNCRGKSEQKFVTLKFTFSPECTSNYHSPIIFDDMRQNQIEFTCKTEEKVPGATMSLNIVKDNITQDITKFCSSTESATSRTLSCDLNQSLNHFLFVCNVTQQSQPSFVNQYEGSCTFGPLLFLSGFSVLTYPSVITVKQGDDLQEFNLNCTSNVSGVAMKWSNIPRDWNYNETKDEYGIYLHVFSVGYLSSTSPTTSLKCIGAYGNMKAFDYVTVHISSKGYFITLYFLFFVLFLVIIICLVVCFLLIKRKNSSSIREPSANYQIRLDDATKNQMGTAANELNTNKANNAEENSENDDRTLRESEPEEEDGNVMFVNTIYESASDFIVAGE